MMASPPLYGILHQSQLFLTIKPLLHDFLYSDIYMDDIYPTSYATYTQNLTIFSHLSNWQTFTRFYLNLSFISFYLFIYH